MNQKQKDKLDLIGEKSCMTRIEEVMQHMEKFLKSEKLKSKEKEELRSTYTLLENVVEWWFMFTG